MVCLKPFLKLSVKKCGKLTLCFHNWAFICLRFPIFTFRHMFLGVKFLQSRLQLVHFYTKLEMQYGCQLWPLIAATKTLYFALLIIFKHILLLPISHYSALICYSFTMLRPTHCIYFEAKKHRTMHGLPWITWWRNQMETFSALLAICAGNSPVPGDFPTQRPVTRSFDVYFDMRPNKRLSKQSWGWWFETLSHPFWRHRNAILWSRVRRFANNFHEWRSHEWKSLANRITSDPKIAILGNEGIILFLARYFMSWTHNSTENNHLSLISLLSLRMVFSDLALWRHHSWFTTFYFHVGKMWLLNLIISQEPFDVLTWFERKWLVNKVLVETIDFCG